MNSSMVSVLVHQKNIELTRIAVDWRENFNLPGNSKNVPCGFYSELVRWEFRHFSIAQMIFRL